jgi:succinate dehydrogenase/fumarate reductase flavoprotein subunit
MAGSEIIFGLNKVVKKFVTENKIEMMYQTKLKSIRTTNNTNENENISGALLINVKTGEETNVITSHLILATGGFAADTSKNGVLARYRPDLLGLASTNGKFADGSGHLAGIEIGASTVDMKNVQVHPTAFIGKLFKGWKEASSSSASSLSVQSNSKSKRKTLCAELLRGVGGLLLDRTGKRFVNELDKRNVVVAAMKKKANELFGKKDMSENELSYAIVLNEESANIATSHVPHYEKKGLLSKMNTKTELGKSRY